MKKPTTNPKSLEQDRAGPVLLDATAVHLSLFPFTFITAAGASPDNFSVPVVPAQLPLAFIVPHGLAASVTLVFHKLESTKTVSLSFEKQAAVYVRQWK